MKRMRIHPPLALALLLCASNAFAADAGAPAPTDEAADDEAAAPHGHAGHAHGGSEMFDAPPDTTNENASLSTGTLDVAIVDPTGKPLPNTQVTLGILYTSIAKGESRKRVVAMTNERGVARFEHLESGSAVAYRPMVMSDGATFSAMPFRMPDEHGMDALLHVYPIVEDIETALVVTQSVLYAEIKDDRIQIQEAFKIYNFGKSAWVPKDLVVSLPENFTAFSSQQGMSDVGVDAVPKKGVRIRGTFGPGQHVIEFRWQLPYEGEANVSFDVGTPPRMAASRVMVPASRDMKLEVDSYPAPQSTSDGSGQRMLLTERQFRRDEAPLKTVSVRIGGLPTEGPGKYLATLMATAVLSLGLVFGTRRSEDTSRDVKGERSRALAELEDLERARQAGDVGPQTYEKERRRILDAIARTFASEAPRAATARRRAGRA
jgi:hypothetical protein